MKKVKLTYDEIHVLLLILNEFRNDLIEDDRNTDIVIHFTKMFMPPVGFPHILHGSLH